MWRCRCVGVGLGEGGCVLNEVNKRMCGRRTPARPKENGGEADKKKKILSFLYAWVCSVGEEVRIFRSQSKIFNMSW